MRYQITPKNIVGTIIGIVLFVFLIRAAFIIAGFIACFVIGLYIGFRIGRSFPPSSGNQNSKGPRTIIIED